MRPNQTVSVLEELRTQFSAPLFRKGVRLSPDDNQTTCEVYQQWLLLLVDLGYLHLGSTLKREAQRLWIDLIQRDVLDLNNAFAECLHLVRVQSIKGFKALCSRISSHLYQMIKGDLELVSQGDVYSAKRLVQAFAYTTRLTLKDIDLTQQMLEDYLSTEDSILDVFPDPLVRRLNEVIKRWMKPFDPADFHAQHGRKGTAFLGRASLEIKYENLTSDAMLEYAFGSPDWCQRSIRSTLDRISETTFVPKSYKAFRTISMESPTLMYFQQGIWKIIDRLVLRSPYMRARIGFHDQERNKQLARKGSIDRSFATIDLSAASDSVSYELVKKLFKGTKLLRFLMATRSRRTLLPDGQLVTLKKFAPMGSALCFPIETIIFAAVTELVTQEHRTPGKYSVYGDDIIVPTRSVARTIDVLEKLGFRVNREKSFYHDTCWFRESCGGEYCDGFDVTPLRVSRKYNSRERDVQLAELTSLANDSFTRGFRNLRMFFIQKILKAGHKPLFAPTSLLSDNYTNYLSKKRWNSNLQRIEVKVTTLHSRYAEKDLTSQDEEIRYRHWLESTHGRIAPTGTRVLDDCDAFVSVICKSTVSLIDAWAMKPYELPDQEFIDSSRKPKRNTQLRLNQRVEGLITPKM